MNYYLLPICLIGMGFINARDMCLSVKNNYLKFYLHLENYKAKQY